MKIVYLKRLKDGKVIGIPERDVVDTLKQGFELVGEENQAEVPEVEQVKDQMFQCILCEFQTKYENALKVHKGRKHK